MNYKGDKTMRRIYDAEFANETNRSHHKHLGKFWWIDSNGSKDTWTRPEAYDYLFRNPNTVYVQEGNDTAWVKPYSYKDDSSIKWIQTDPDGKLPDNLLTLAKRH